VRPVLILRILLYIQLILGLIIYFGPLAGLTLGRGSLDFHGALGILIAIIALVVLRPTHGVPNSGVRTAARFFPLVPLVFGLGFMFRLISGNPLVIIHMLLGIAALGLVEAAAARQRRAVRQPSA